MKYKKIKILKIICLLFKYLKIKIWDEPKTQKKNLF